MIRFDLSDLDRSRSRSFGCQKLISRNRAELGHMLLLNINRKQCMGGPMTPSHLSLSDLERSKSRSITFRSLISRKGAELGHMLLLNINRKACMGSPLMQLHLTSVTSKGQGQGHSDVESLYIVTELSWAICYY